jgi:hypothetical protein
MALPPIFPLYPESLSGPYNVSLALPGAISQISKSIGVTSSASLLLPNVDFLQKFIEGNLGIGDSILKGMMLENFVSPALATSENVFKKFAELNKIDLGDDINKFKKNGKFVMPKDKITVSKEWDNIGLKSIEKTTLQSIFETQKPYLEIAKLVIENVAKIEDIVARFAPLISTSPLTCKSKKPTGNGGKNAFPKALGYNNGKDLVDELSKLESILNNKKKDSPLGDTENSAEPVDDGKWEIVSTIYSTGTFDPNVEYQYFYKDLPSDENISNPKKSELNLNEEKDPYHKYKPKKLIFGIYDSQGNPIDPNQPLNSIGLIGTNVVNTPTPFKKADWILKSKKWNLPDGVYSWPDYGTPTFVWERGIERRESKTNPNSDADPAWRIKKYKEGEKDLISKEDAIPGNPVIVKFDTTERTEYSSIFTDFVKFGFHKTDINKEEKETLTKEIVGKLDIQNHLQNVYNFGQLRSSYYKRIDGKDPVPELLKKSYKPYKIYSAKAAVDQEIRDFSIANGIDPGFIWIEPESDYDMKLIRIDPSTKINYLKAEGEPQITANIQSFVKNRLKITFSNNIQFSVSVSKNNEVSEITENVTEYSLENWNYENRSVINTNQYEYTIWSSVPPQEYIEKSSFTKKSTTENNSFYELIKEGSDYYYRKFKFNINSNDTTVERFIYWLNSNSSLLDSIYSIYVQNANATYTFTLDSSSYSIELKKIFTKKEFEYYPEGDIILFTDGDESMIKSVRIDNMGKITRWYYIQNRIFTGPQSKKEGSVTLENGETNYLPTFGVERNLTIDYTTKTTKNDKNHIMRFEDSDFSLFKIKINSDNPFGSIIDPTKITNEQLSTNTVYSEGKYGHGSEDEPQEVAVVKRYMLTDLDTESYYVVEGVLRNAPQDDPLDTVPASASDGYYRLPDALGALKVFLGILVSIFSKLIPQINKLINLFKNPSKFVTDIISEKAGENILFLNKDSMRTFTDGFKKVTELVKIPNKPLPPEQIMLGDNVKYTTGLLLNGKRVEAIKELKKLFKNSNLSNYVFVDDEGKLTSIFDGTAMIPFGIFGINLPFGIKLDSNLITEGKSPLQLIFPKDFKLRDVKDLTKSLNLKKFDDEQPNLKDFIQPALNLSDEFIVKFQDGSQRILPENSLDEFVLDNKTKYNFIFVEEDTQQTILNVDKLLESGSQDDLQLALDKVDKALKSKPKDNLLREKFDRIKELLDKLEISQNPLLKLLLGLITLPIKLIGGIVEWLLNFFKSLANPATLPQKMIELLSFQWVMQFFTPKGLLEVAGIRFKPEKQIEWATQVLIPGKGTGLLPKSLKLPEDIKNLGFNKLKIKSDNFLSGDDDKIIDLSLFLNVIFNVKLPTLSPLQLRQNLKLPAPLLSGFLCFIEKIINAIIDFVWATLGIEAIIAPPHIKLCNKDKNDPENASKITSGQNDANLEEFYYEVKLEDGQILNFINREELDKFISENIDLNYDFNF